MVLILLTFINNIINQDYHFICDEMQHLTKSWKMNKKVKCAKNCSTVMNVYVTITGIATILSKLNCDLNMQSVFKVAWRTKGLSPAEAGITLNFDPI